MARNRTGAHCFVSALLCQNHLHSHGNVLYTLVSGSLLRLNDVQARVRRIDPSAYALGMLCYSDATETKMNKHKFHPLLVMLANFTLDALRSSRGYRRIALLPVLDSKPLGNSPKTLQSLAALKELSHRCSVLQACLTAQLS